MYLVQLHNVYVVHNLTFITVHFCEQPMMGFENLFKIFQYDFFLNLMTSICAIAFRFILGDYIISPLVSIKTSFHCATPFLKNMKQPYDRMSTEWMPPKSVHIITSQFLITTNHQNPFPLLSCLFPFHRFYAFSHFLSSFTLFPFLYIRPS